MADAFGVTVNELLPSHIDQLADSVDQHVKSEPHALARLARGLVKSQADHQLRDVLKVDVFELIAKAWAGARAMHNYTDASAHPPDQTEIMHLGEHTVTATVHPVLQIIVAGIKLEPMRFSLILSAQLQAAALSIRNAAIIAASPGDASATAELRYRDVRLHDPLPLRTIHLPTLKTFEPGIRIP
jgi:hypothetical protein